MNKNIFKFFNKRKGVYCFMEEFISCTYKVINLLFRKSQKKELISYFTAYYLTVILSFIICHLSKFNFFEYLLLKFDLGYIWIGYLMTAFLIAGGERFIREKFKILEEIPSRLDFLTIAGKASSNISSNNNNYNIENRSGKEDVILNE